MMKGKFFTVTLTIFLITLVILGGLYTEADAQVYEDYIDQRNELQNYKALVYQINNAQKNIVLHFLNGERSTFNFNEDLIIFEDKEEIDLAELNVGDALIASIDPDQKIKFLEKIDYSLENIKDLSDLGYGNDITIYGTNINQDIFFPFSENMDKEQMQFDLNLEYSRFIEPDSKIVIKLEDEEIYLNTISELNKDMVSEGIYSSKISLNLSRYINNGDLNDKVIKISILADLKTRLNRCEEVNSDVFFFRIKNNSKLRSRNKAFFNYNIADFLNYKFNKVNIHLPEELSSEIAESYLKLNLFLDRNFAKLEKNLFFDSDYKADEIISRDFKTANIFIKEGNQIELDKNFNLSLGSQAADSFISRVRTLYLNDEMKVIDFNEDEKKLRQLSLSELGYNSLVFNGIGEIERNISFSSADLGSNPEELEFYINSEYTAPINNQSTDKDNSYLKIYFNGQLIRAHQLDYSGRIDNLHLDLPLYLFEQENNLKLVYSYYPLGRDCAADGQDFEAVISPNSYLNIKGEKVDDVITFNNLLNNFYGNGRIMLDVDNKELSLKYAAKVISSYRKLDSRSLNLNVDFVNNDYEFKIGDSFRWAIAVLPAYQDYSIQNLVKINEGEVNLQQDSNEFVFEGKSPNKSAAWQLDKIDAKPFSLITTSDLSQESLVALELLSEKISNVDYYRNLNGTLLLSSGGRLTDFAADDYETIKADQRNFLVNIYKNYKVQLFISFIILIIILAYLAYLKLAQKPEEK
ncbi:hypothetical protein HSACCH_00307 [Halanaerobium saccharolyticum subsp. saccharolyticum DSM 6643]|uniref:Cellulose synthase subunit n=1 Tax=Halanaerobium saccharolyticum subsp. saccharolyticum DSM 6643 TaxID=1293054 RepID=M5DX68_9FIRM|nr:cellulose biosynthesis cyclic di-GMP-binding regulatory protein BcsB [Halanaerobium saccharolyticum]CCU77970.1 hypothetical protein HSACCH_00307 [Halanaerobium saccharolyticum subsp. saccharolyticum DSM 6643]